MNALQGQNIVSQQKVVTQVLFHYFDGLYHSDTRLLAAVFHPQAHYVCATEGALVYRNMDEYLPIVNKRPSPASLKERRQDRIVSIEFAGPVTAIARVECAIGNQFFTDFLTLIKLNQQWRIISKVFHYERLDLNV
ncbi:nuclear transport factor 2 family protein [uncultured Shewanella sp.]|uniref:nuclear transport factor 2 family protein n=1 Tax=uncultured Shewanella sp. TaxID=173975 RepID=UPI002623EF7B|nr:nuclear transport factor 2 family protein [uncultured Shewanella sp.]